MIMRNVWIVAAVLSGLFWFASCRQAGTSATVEGVVFDATMNNMALITGAGDTVNISTMDTDPDAVPGVLIGDSVRVVCRTEKTADAEILRAEELTVTARSPYYYIQGAWVEPNPVDASQVQGFRFNEDGTAVSVGMQTLRAKAWELLDGRKLALTVESIGNGTSFEGVDTLRIVRIDADSLVLAAGEQVVWRLVKEK